MDRLDKILLEHLPDTGLCARGKRIQADRRGRMKAAILMWFLAESMPKRLVPNSPSGGTFYGDLSAGLNGDNPNRKEYIITNEQLERIEGHNHLGLPDLIIDEMQMGELERKRPKTNTTTFERRG